MAGLSSRLSGLVALALVLASGPVLAGKADAPVPAATLALMAARDTTPSAPILMRSFKKEGEIEVWKLARSGRYVFLKSFPICRWSGQLGPKMRNGDRQAPEGFYPVAPRQMNPNSHYYLSFDLGYPNAYDRAHGATGSALMVHGICSSAGCYAMTDAQVGEIYALARDAFAGGQKAFQFQAFPFRMTAANMALHRTDPNIAFWRQLKEGSDRFEATGEEPAVSVSDGRYVFGPSRDGSKEAAATARLAAEREKVASLIEEGAAAIRTSYADGGQNPYFAALMRRGVSLGDVSRPEALAFAGREITLIAARRKPVAVAALPPAAPRGSTVGSVEPSLFGASALGTMPPPSALGAVLGGSVTILSASMVPIRSAAAAADGSGSARIAEAVR